MNTRSLLKASLLTLRQGIEATMIYRLSVFQTVIVECLAFGGIAFYWHTAASTAPVQIFTTKEILAYFFITWLLQITRYPGTTNEISSDIRLGRLSYSIVRPYPYLLVVLMRSLAHTVFHVLLFGVSAAILYFYFGPSVTPQNAILFMLATVMGFFIGELLYIATGLLAFQMTQVWGPATLVLAFYFATSGASYPPNLLDEPYRELVTYSPTYFMVGFPALLLLNKVPQDQVAALFTRGLIIIVCMMGLVGFQWKRGVRYFEGVGI
jgi:ABC-2 type transport system permease protein